MNEDNNIKINFGPPRSSNGNVKVLACCIITQIIGEKNQPIWSIFYSLTIPFRTAIKTFLIFGSTFASWRAFSAIHQPRATDPSLKVTCLCGNTPA